MESNGLIDNSTTCPSGGIETRHNSSLRLHLEFIPHTVHLVRFLIPLWLALGLPGSFLSLSVWSNRRMRSSSSVYLCALAVLDAVFLLLQQLPWHLQQYYDIPILHNRPMCQVFPVYSMWLQYLSPVLILAFTVERYIGICHPFSSEKLCTERKAVTTTACLTGGCLLLGMMQLKFFGYDSTVGICLEDRRIFITDSAQNRFYSIWTKTTEVLFFAIAPLFILAFNLLVLAQVRRSYNAQTTRHLDHQRRKSQSTAATVTLLSISFYQIGVMLPVTALLFASVSMGSTDLEGLTCNLTDTQVRKAIQEGHLPQLRTFFAHAAATNIVSGLAVSHNALKFFIYLATGELFRRELIRLLCPRFLATVVGVTRVGSVGGGGITSEYVISLPCRRTSEQRRRLRRSPYAAETEMTGTAVTAFDGFQTDDNPLLPSQQSCV